MPQAATHQPLSELSYLDARKVQSPAGFLADIPLVSSDGKRVGTIAGVIIDASARRVRYLEVQSTGWLSRRYLVDAEQLAQVDPEQKVLRLLDDDIAKIRDLDPTAIHPFNDDDLITAIFSTRTPHPVV